MRWGVCSRVPQLKYIWMSLPGASGLGNLTSEVSRGPVCQDGGTETDRQLSGYYGLAPNSPLLHMDPNSFMPLQVSKSRSQERGRSVNCKIATERTRPTIALSSLLFWHRESIRDKLSIMSLLAARYLAPVSHH